MPVNPLRSIIDQLRTHIASEAAKHIQTPAFIVTIEEILKDECWLVRHGNTGLTMYVIRNGEFYALTAQDMFGEAADTYTERLAGVMLRSRIREQGNTKTP